MRIERQLYEQAEARLGRSRRAWLRATLAREPGVRWEGMQMDYHELRAMTIVELREVAGGVEGLTGYTQMRKDKLLETVCEHLGIPLHEHHEVVGIDKAGLKQQIRALKVERGEALEKRDRAALKQVRRRIHKLKRSLRRATV